MKELVFHRLLLPTRSQRDIRMPLDAAPGVPLRLSVPNKD